MTDIRFLLNEGIGELTWDDWICLENGLSSKSRDILARFMVDKNDKPVPLDAAKAALGKLKITQVAEITSAFWKAAKDSSVNPTTGG